MKRFFLIIILIGVSLLAAQTTVPGGNVSGTWDLAGSPYLIEGEIEVANGETLTIDPGCLIEFQGYYKFNVQGRLLALGTQQDSIKFTIADTTGFSDYYNIDGGWNGFRFDSSPAINDSSKIKYSIIEFSKSPNGSDYGYFVISSSSLIISNSTFRNNFTHDYGISIDNSSCIFLNNLFIRNAAYRISGMNISYSSIKLFNNIFSNNICINNTHTPGLISILSDNQNVELINNTISYNVSRYPNLITIGGNTTLINNTIWHNQGSQVSIEPNTNNDITIAYNNIENAIPNYQGYYDTNIDAEPSFISENDFHLNPTSPCINRGIPDTSGLNLPIFDFDLNPRIFNGDSPRIDIGAYEYQGEHILLYPDFTTDVNSGLAPLMVQFTDLSEGEIAGWEWDFDNDGIIDSYEQNPEYTYLETGIFSVSLTINNDGYEMTKMKNDFIEVTSESLFFEEKLTFSKINANDELKSIQLFDFDGDGEKEIYACYTNSIERYFRIQGIDINGEQIYNEIIPNSNLPEELADICLLEYNNAGYIATVLKVSLGHYHYVILRIHSLENIQFTIEDISQIASTDCRFKQLISHNDTESLIYIGLKVSSYNSDGGNYGDTTFRYVFNEMSLSKTQIGGVGSLIYPESNIGVGNSVWWNDEGYSGHTIQFRSLDGVEIFDNYELWDPSWDNSYGLVSLNDDYIEDYGSVIYFDGDLKCYSPNFSTLLWQVQMSLSEGFSSSTITYENENIYLILYDKENASVNIIDRITGQIVYSQNASFYPFIIEKTTSNELILFEENNDVYTVYTKDPNYYSALEDHEIPQITKNYNLNNYPNPFNPSTVIEFSIPNYANVDISIYNIKGQKVKSLTKESYEKGIHKLTWHGVDDSHNQVSSGIYFYKLAVNGKTEAFKKCLLLK